jgi:hypothetical protein
MKYRFFVATAIVTVLSAAAWLAPTAAAGQGPSASAANSAAKTYTAPRTPDGQPDLQGYWTNAGYAPLERPDDVTKEFFTTKEEAAEYEKRFVDYEAAQTEPGTIPDVHYDHTQFGLDRSIAGYTTNMRTSLIVDPPNGKLPPLSAEGKRRQAERAEARKRSGPYDGPENLPLGTRCVIMDRNGPPYMYGNYNNTYQIVQTPGYVMILAEMLHDARIIPLDNRPQLPGTVRQWVGSSRGHWEGETLVVETTNFNGKNPFRGFSSEQMRVTERFTRTEEGAIRYQFTVDDPATWTRSWTGEMPIKKTVGPIFEHACHEGNYGLLNILAGARAEEKKAAEEAAKKSSSSR